MLFFFMYKIRILIKFISQGIIKIIWYNQLKYSIKSSILFLLLTLFPPPESNIIAECAVGAGIQIWKLLWEKFSGCMGHMDGVGSLFTHKPVSSLGSLQHEICTPGSLVVDSCSWEYHRACCGTVQWPGAGMDLMEAGACLPIFPFQVPFLPRPPSLCPSCSPLSAVA